MIGLNVRVVRLEPMRVASARVISRTPEQDAWEKLQTWASRKGLLNDATHPVFGFNNPNPSPGQEEYGYEFWINIDPESEGEGEIEVKNFEGGLYAITTCRLQRDPAGSVPQVWKKLWDWAQSNDKYRWRKTHELERCLNPQAAGEDLLLELFLPIEERAGS
jgi:DNA gyrase inhibitor GyrI